MQILRPQVNGGYSARIVKRGDIMAKRIFEYDEYGPGMGFPSMKLSMLAEPYEGMGRIVDYLRHGKKTYAAAGKARDFFTGEMIPGEQCGMTDGTYSWNSSLIYYVEKYNLRLLPEFEEHVLRAG